VHPAGLPAGGMSFFPPGATVVSPLAMNTSPRWSTNTKLIVMLAVLAAVGFLLSRFQILIMPLTMAVILAYLLNPVVTALTRRLRIPRPVAVLILYGILILILTGLVGGAGLLLRQQFSGVLDTILAFVNSLPEWVRSLTAEPLAIGPFTLDFSGAGTSFLQDALLPSARDWVGEVTQWMTDAASGIAAFLGWIAFTFIVAYYLLHDMDAVQKGLLWPVPPDHRRDAQRLLDELGPIWDAFLRGQLLLSLIMGLVIGLAMAVLGVRYALILGLMAAVAEFVPIIGANVVGATAVLIALFQTSNWLGLPPIPYAVIVGLTSAVLQQLESNFLIPRVMGGGLKLHPAVLIVGALAGFSLLGLAGLLLAGPIIATARLFGKYVHAKMFNLPPWPEDARTLPGSEPPSRRKTPDGARTPAPSDKKKPRHPRTR
jgi:predicted PurR-regulated permease PerM